MSGEPCCDVTGCESNGDIVSRLSPEGYLAYRQFRYCKKCHDYLMSSVWNRINSAEDKSGDHVAPTAI